MPREKDLVKSAGRMLKKAGKKFGKKAARHILKATAPYWGPPVLILFMAYMAYVMLFSIPAEAMHTVTSTITKVEAFLGITASPDAQKKAEAEKTLLTRYKTIANTWDKGLTQNQRSQVMVYKFPWSMLMAVDRVVNDDAVWEGKRNVHPHPQAVFNALQPQFSWKDSTITTVTVSCHNETTTDKQGNKSSQRVCTTTTSKKQVKLVTAADTFEGHFSYAYKWQTTTSPGPGGGSVTVTREVVKQITPPKVLYLPLKAYLKKARGIKDEATFEVVTHLAMTYDPEYAINLGIQGGQNFATSPTYALAYANEVTLVLAQHPDIPQPLFLALIAHESVGNWRAKNYNKSDGTTDAGLCQINSTNWAAYGLASDPFNVVRNISAGASILDNALSQYNDITQALYAYNGGTASNGERYNPTYAPSVLAIYTQLQSTPAFAVYVPAMDGQPWTLLAAEQDNTTWQAYGQSGVDFTNPSEITVTDERTGKSELVPRTGGDGTLWANEAAVYHPSLGVQRGDTMNVQFDDGKDVTVKAQ
ncbi:transglycosylase SLT domain protein [Peptococcaceae bacterium CEB3]|nr:transglycosylase SLT domain protein [Peptococcaceae bacterium CEB3]